MDSWAAESPRLSPVGEPNVSDVSNVRGAKVSRYIYQVDKTDELDQARWSGGDFSVNRAKDRFVHRAHPILLKTEHEMKAGQKAGDVTRQKFRERDTKQREKIEEAMFSARWKKFQAR